MHQLASGKAFVTLFASLLLRNSTFAGAGWSLPHICLSSRYWIPIALLPEREGAIIYLFKIDLQSDRYMLCFDDLDCVSNLF